MHWQLIGGDGFDDEQFGEYFYFISLRVKSVQEIILKDWLVTDAGVKFMSLIQGLKLLYLRKHEAITQKSIEYFNDMKSLESLNVTLTSIHLNDMCAALNNQMLKELFISSNEADSEETIAEMGLILKERMPNCNVYLNTCFTKEFSGLPIAPIF